MHELAETATRYAIIDFTYSLLDVDFFGNKFTTLRIFPHLEIKLLVANVFSEENMNYMICKNSFEFDSDVYCI